MKYLILAAALALSACATKPPEAPVVSAPEVKTAPKSGGTGGSTGCGSRGGPGTVRADGRCASW